MSPNTTRKGAVTPVGQDDDAALAVRASKGEAAAFGLLYDRHVEAIYRYVYYRVRDDAEAEDLTSDVFMRALKAMPRYEPRQAFLAWLYRIARNAVIDRARRGKRQVSYEDALEHPTPDQIVDPDDQLLERAENSALRAALAKLTPLQQEVVVLRFLEGFSTQEIARIVGKREGTVRGIQFRAIGALRQLIPRRDELTERADGAELDAAHGPLALADDACDLLSRETLEEAKHDDLLLERGQLRERGTERGVLGAFEELVVGIDDLVGRRMLERVLVRDLALAAARAVDHRVARDAIEPGEERLTRLVSWHRLEGSHEHVARKILRFRVVANSVVHVPVDRFDVPVVEKSERRSFALGRPHGERCVVVLPYWGNGSLSCRVRRHHHSP